MVFDGMFSGPPHTGEEVEGCPFILLFGDNPAEVRCMLNEMYGLRERSNRKVTLDLLCTLVRLGEKYDVPAMRAEGDNILKEIYGVPLETFQQRIFQASFSAFVDPSSRPDFPIAPWKRQNCFDIYVLARDHDMKIIAGRALYECCRWSLADLKPEITKTLTPDVLWACALARELLAKRGAEQLLKLDPSYIKSLSTTGLYGIPSTPCGQQEICGPAMEKTFEIISFGLAPERLHPADDGYRNKFIQRLSRQLCNPYQAKVSRAIQIDAHAVYDSLPDILAPALAGLPV